MFVQVIKGHTKDPAGYRRQIERWNTDVRPGAVGYLGSTGGVAADGTTIGIVRFTDEASARANADRPEQSAWFEEMSKLADRAPQFRESSDISTLLAGGSDQAGFVQVMEGHVKDRAKAEAFETPEMLEDLRRARPDLIGSTRVWFTGGEFVDVAYFTSEADARKGEKSEDFAGPTEEYLDLFADMTFIDLPDPILMSP